jgi:hypothetical protein
MIQYMNRLCDHALRYVGHLTPQEWLLVLAVVVLLGLICMRGFGSRSSY